MGHFHEPHSFDDDDYRPFRRGEMKAFKQRLKEHGQSSGNTELAKKMWRNGGRAARKSNSDHDRQN